MGGLYLKFSKPIYLKSLNRKMVADYLIIKIFIPFVKNTKFLFYDRKDFPAINKYCSYLK